MVKKVPKTEIWVADERLVGKKRITILSNNREMRSIVLDKNDRTFNWNKQADRNKAWKLHKKLKKVM